MLILLRHDKIRVFCIKAKKMYMKNQQVGPPLALDIESLFNKLSIHLTKHTLHVLPLISTQTTNDYSLEVVIKHDLHHILGVGYKYGKNKHENTKF